MNNRLVPSSPLTPPSRPLQWGDVNIIHTTDTHGWLLGHQKHAFPEPNYRCALISDSARRVYPKFTGQRRLWRLFLIRGSHEEDCPCKPFSLSLLELFDAF